MIKLSNRQVNMECCQPPACQPTATFHESSKRTTAVVKKEKRESRLEKYIKNFVCERTAEHVYLLLQDKIFIKHARKDESLTKSGSITLAMFWANVLQYPTNFPPARYPYRKYHDEEIRTDYLMVKADGIIFTVNMKTGTLSMAGQRLYEWFSSKFIFLLDNYDEEFQKNWNFQPTPLLDFPPPDDDTFGNPLTETEEYLLMYTSTHKKDSALEERVKEHSLEVISGIGDLSIDPGLITGEDLDFELQRLSPGTLKDSLHSIYVLWKSLLTKWFGTPDTKVYMATSSLDAKRIGDIVNIFMQYRINGSLDAFYVTHKCDADSGKSVIQLQKEAAASYSPKEQTFVEYHLFRKMLCPLQKFDVNFIAAVKDGVAEVLITSCPFHGSHFSNSVLSFVSYAQMSDENFIERYLKPISSPVAATLY